MWTIWTLFTAVWVLMESCPSHLSTSSSSPRYLTLLLCPLKWFPWIENHLGNLPMNWQVSDNIAHPRQSLVINNNNNNYDNLYGAVKWPYRYKGALQANWVGRWFPNCEPRLPWEEAVAPKGAANYYNQFFTILFFIPNFVSIHWCRFSTIYIKHLFPHAYL